MRSARYRPLLFGLAVVTAATALLPIVVGALVTSHKAGMAFADWPTSDGQGMFAYPWLKSAGDKFIEHGHRLAGIIIGCVSIVFAAACFALEPRRWLRWCGVCVLLAVIAQGLLGGGRVLADARLLAMLHGALAAAVFTFMSSVALFLSRSWNQPPKLEAGRRLGALNVLAVVTPAVLLLQYSLGGFVRHLGTAIYEHVGTAFLALTCIVATVIVAHRTHCGWLRRPAWLLGVAVVAQMLLGAAGWVAKFGFAPWGYVAVERSPVQVALLTSHTVVGMLLVMLSVNLLLRVARIEWSRRTVPLAIERAIPAIAAPVNASAILAPPVLEGSMR
ncbi:MAG TPA: COX15/CtaA family protein [Planctomycetaceae bacterium]|nr:COX15/CtaA family protein [Planctomycetaceae bacterium]